MQRKFTSILILIFTVVVSSKAQQSKIAGTENFKVRIVADKLSDPWEVTYGPDNFLYVTEARGYIVSRINPLTGSKKVLLDLTALRKFPRYDRMKKEQSGGKPWPQGGLMGLTLHPQFTEGKPFIYLTYVYHFDGADSTGEGCKLNWGGCYFTARLVRYRYNTQEQTLTNPEVLCDSIPSSSDHTGGRLLIAPVNGKDYLFYSIGDMGAGQFNNGGRPNHAQQTDYYEGKILRFNIEPDSDAGQYDKWIPNDNPFNSKAQNAVWTYGHRNPQGLAYAVINGKGYLYSSEHGPYSDDEINIIEKGKNYGHPLIIGYADGNYNGLAASVSDRASLPGKWHTTYPLIESEQANAKMLGANYAEPLKTLYPNSASFLNDFFNVTVSGQKGPEWASEAPSSIEVYTSSAIPGWKNSLLIPTLKGGKLIRLKLNASGNKIESDTINYFKSTVRYRDIALSPDGKKIYLAVDSSSVSSGPSEENKQQVNYRGCILEFTYQPGAPEKQIPVKRGTLNAPANLKRDDRE